MSTAVIIDGVRSKSREWIAPVLASDLYMQVYACILSVPPLNTMKGSHRAIQEMSAALQEKKQRRHLTKIAYDWLILIAYILTLGQTVASVIYIKIGYVGIHIWDVPPLSPEDVLKQNKWIFVNQVLYNPALTFVKVSVLMFLRRIDSRSYRLHMLWEMFYPSGPPRKDFTYSIAFASSVIEESGAIAAACGPSLKALISVYLPNLLGKSNGSHEEISGPRRQLQRSNGYIRSDEQGQIEMGNVYAQMHRHDKGEGPWGGETFVVSDTEAGKNTTTITGEVRNNDQIMRTTNLAVSSYRV
ncbi:hypothetical protein KEM56_001179 [Ascosphaera pollenicola]|nr:hypothetical protein KEM56_001179 [Ascosphaera pollenicola]